MWRSLSIAVLGLTVLGAAAAQELSVQELIVKVRTAIERRTPDKTLARALRKLTLSERLDLRSIEELESEGAGRESVEALENLRDAAAKLPAPAAVPPFHSPARPSLEEQKEFFRRMNANAMHYTAGLPDFICTEVVQRFQLLPRPPGRRSAFTPFADGTWHRKDTLTLKLTYFENRERYQLTMINGRKTARDYESTGGAISEGDFGSSLLEIFSPKSRTGFRWDHWTHLRKRLTRVYSYRTPRESSQYRIGVGEPKNGRQTVVVGRHGLVYADDVTAMIVRVVGEAEEIPQNFPVTAQSSVADYDYATVGGTSYLLPLRVDNRMEASGIRFRNVVEFQEYRKFAGESTITFDRADGDAPQTPEK